MVPFGIILRPFRINPIPPGLHVGTDDRPFGLSLLNVAFQLTKVK